MNAATHEFLPEEVMAFLDDELSPEKTVSISAHLEACPECRELTAQLKSTSQSLSQWQIDKPKASLQERIMDVANGQPWVAAKPTWPLHLQRFFSRRLPWALACLAMVLLIGIR